MPDKGFYKIIADELATKKVDAAIWTQAIAIAEGDPDRTQAAYIRLRFLDLKKSAPRQTTTPAQAKPLAATAPIADGLTRMRAELTRRLRAQGKSSLYSTLSVSPDASDAIITSAIADIEARAMTGAETPSAEFRYAKETLGDPVLRERYDRKLLDGLLNEDQAPARQLPYEVVVANDYSWWQSRKMSVIIGVASITLLGYLALGFFKAKNGHEIQKEVVDVQREAVHSITETEQQRAQAAIEQQNRNQELMEQRQRDEWSYRVQMAEQQREIQQREQDRRDAMDRERVKAQQQQQDNMRAQREKQYWACMNQQLGMRDVSSYDASARCAMYH